MPDTYTHPNGTTITNLDGTVLSIESESGYYALTKDETDTLRNYLLAELGLWRDEETGAPVVTSCGLGSSDRRHRRRTGPSRLGHVDDEPDFADEAVARWRATLTPPPREPKPGEVWRIELDDGTERNAIVDPAGELFSAWVRGSMPVTGIPADRRLLLVEADGTVVTGDE